MAKILLIDDDDLLRDTVLQMLEADGHRVSEAASGEQGLKLFGTGTGGFDLVISDILMPGAGGARTIAEIKRLVPNQPVIAISGGRRVLSAQFNLDTATMAGAGVQLAKPFGRVELRAAVAQALAAASTAG